MQEINATESLYDVVIAGAGPVGLTLANTLHQLLANAAPTLATRDKLKILVVDQSPSLSRISKAIAIHARTHESLALLGPQADIPQKLIHAELDNIDDASPNRGGIARAIHLRDDTGSLLAEMYPLSPAIAQSPFPSITLRSQVDTERFLYDDLIQRKNSTLPNSDSATVSLDNHFDTQVTGIHYDSHFPTHPIRIDLSTERSIHASYLIGCDGGRSTIRHLLSIPFPGQTRNDIMWLCDTRISTSHESGSLPVRLSPKSTAALMSMHLHPTYGTMIVFPLQDGDHAPDGGYFRIAMFGGDDQARDMFGSVDAAMDADESATASQFVNKLGGSGGSDSRPKLSALQAMFNARFQVPYAQSVAPGHSVPASYAASTDYVLTNCTWRTRFRVNERLADTYLSPLTSDPSALPRILLAGDACHVHSPMGGQGMNLGIQDATNLAWKLALVVLGRARDPTRVLRTYEAERRPQAKAIVAMTSSLTDWAARRAWVVRFALGTFLPWFVGRWPGVMRPEAVARNVGLEVVYGKDGWVDGKTRVSKGEGGMALRYPVGHRAPTRARLMVYPPPAGMHDVCVTPLDLYVDAGLRFTVLVMYPATSATTTVEYAIPDRTAEFVRVHHIALLTSPPHAVHPLDLPPVPMVVAGSQARVHNKLNASAGDEFVDYRCQVVPQTAIKQEWGNRWIDSDGSVAKFCFGVTHDATFGGASPQKPWVVVVRPDGVMSLCGLGVEVGEVVEHLAEYLVL
ncbi:hypothetical protein BCR44DRAFT_1427693 [Catenaria anguillulae PL171]|uniref:FAD-binding domain-containing protein n=1 Tax=Catenaria anguillulae PL171 TaxID=765915 RepID=A0A1Y2HVU6_9FUNG|nr:hypothetical protein BCR44DRAFT_1427693 [Catenaria anguillulae PL171]